jgi:hypothetical protein
LDLQNPLFQKLWRVASLQGHFDPWHPRLLDKTEAQLDLILEAYSVDHPKELRFERRRTREEKERPIEVLKGWADVLIGDAKEDLLRQVSFKLPPRFQQRGPVRLPPSMKAVRRAAAPPAPTDTVRPTPRRK